nr:Phenylacetic acid degradation operon negative regulatory protein paaX [Kibdelosporangium sp. MJ126-NF4]CTQ89158.1 Phenylacetic acid degradation operon negative regulatory protein paaX [Kibdelosporangium sp. MJ126-NF4]
MQVTAGELDLKPLSARSVVLSVLLGIHPPELPVRYLVRLAGEFRITEPALRVALTRMTAAGDLARTGSTYRLADRLLDRQRRQDDAIHTSTRDWDGEWEIVVVTALGRPAGDRAELRAALTQLRLAELREGVWTRPANLARALPTDLRDSVQSFTGRPDIASIELANTLWDLPGWAARAHALIAHFTASTSNATRFTIAAAIVRHLLADPALPEALRPPDWPADALRALYAEYQTELILLSDAVTSLD